MVNFSQVVFLDLIKDSYKSKIDLKNIQVVTSSVIKTFNVTVHPTGNANELYKYKKGEKITIIEPILTFHEICERFMASYIFLEDNLHDVLNSIDTFR